MVVHSFKKRSLVRLLLAAQVVVSFIFGSLWAVPPTQSYLSMPELSNLVHESWAKPLVKYDQIIHMAMATEQNYHKTHHVFYHAQLEKFRVYQDFLKELYAFLNPTTYLNDFYFLRSWHNFPATIDANAFIDSYESIYGTIWDDNGSSLVRSMLSVNFSLFGSTKNYGNFGECTFKYFFAGKSIKPPQIDALFQELFSDFNFDKKYIAEILQLSDIIKTDEGSLYQICVPRALVDTIAFAAQRKGTPYRNPLIGYDFDSYKQRHLHLTPLLDAYCNNPESIGPQTLDRLQGRLLFSQDILLNPKSGVKIFRYTTIPQEKQQKYQQKLHQLTQKLFKTWLKKVYAGTKKINIPLKFQDITELVEYYDISK